MTAQYGKAMSIEGIAENIGQPHFRPSPTRKVSEDLSREAFGLTVLTVRKVRRKPTGWDSSRLS